MNRMMTAEIAWVSGLFEGEGTFGISTVGRVDGRKYNQVYLALHSTDKDVIERCQRLTGVGVIYPFKKKADHYKQPYMWKVGRRQDVEDLIWTMLPYLGERRSTRAHEALAVIDQLNQLAMAKKAANTHLGGESDSDQVLPINSRFVFTGHAAR